MRRLRYACAWGSDLVGRILLARLQHRQSGGDAAILLNACAEGLAWLMATHFAALLLPPTAPGFAAAPLPSLYAVLAFVQVRHCC